MSLQPPLCPQCGTQAALLFKTKDFNRHLSDVEFPYFRCPNCGVIFLDPIPADLGRYYPPEYYPIPRSLADLLPEVKGQNMRLAHLMPFLTSGRLLEIGPAYGAFAYAAQQAGFSVQVIEMDERCCRFLAETVGVEVLQSDDPAQAILQLGQFDAVVLWQVIEHLADPWLMLERIADHVVPGGLVALSAPNPGSLQFRLMHGRWPHVDAPRHLELMPVPTLARFMEQRGFVLRRVSTSDPESRGWNAFGWDLAFYHMLHHKTPARLLSKGWSRLVAPLERSGSRGSTYTLVFQKEPR